ncbi:MAG: CBS domain-containing protein [Oscillospiraceae bacterium]|nr:CBS domain-containing protein [Oscillospiraceae bacterium]
MKVRDIMTNAVIKIHPEESVEVAARALAHYNIGALPVCDDVGKVCGLVTDRDLVTRCIAANKPASATKVRDVMTNRVLSVTPDTQIGVAAHLMGRQQVRRLPVVENGTLCGMVSLGDLASREESAMDAADALSDITSNIADPMG